MLNHDTDNIFVRETVNFILDSVDNALDRGREGLLRALVSSRFPPSMPPLYEVSEHGSAEELAIMSSYPTDFSDKDEDEFLLRVLMDEEPLDDDERKASAAEDTSQYSRQKRKTSLIPW